MAIFRRGLPYTGASNEKNVDNDSRSVHTFSLLARWYTRVFGRRFYFTLAAGDKLGPSGSIGDGT